MIVEKKPKEEIEFLSSFLLIFSGLKMEINSTIPTNYRGGSVECRILIPFSLASPFFFHLSLSRETFQEVLYIGSKKVTDQNIQLNNFSPLSFEFNGKIFNEEKKESTLISGLIIRTINQMLLDQTQPDNITFELRGGNCYRYFGLPKSRDELIYKLFIHFSYSYNISLTHV